MQINVNGRMHDVRAAGDTPLLWVLRDELGLKGAKYGCGLGACGACTVHVDGHAAHACELTLAEVSAHEITTIEGVGGPIASAVLGAWDRHEVAQCGFCQSAMVMAATALLSHNRRPSDADIDTALDGNLCRCATYVRVRAAVHSAAAEFAGGRA